MKNIFGQKTGLGLIQVIVAGTIGAILIAALVNAFSGFFKASKTLDHRAQAQGFENLVNLNTGSSASCRETFGIVLGPTGVVDTTGFGATDYRIVNTADLPTTNASPLPELVVPAVKLNAQNYAATSTDFQELKVQDLRLKFDGKSMANAPGLYPVTFVFRLNKKAGSSLGSDEFTRSVKLNVKYVDHPTQAGKKVMADCFSVHGGSPAWQQTCTELGGRVLTATLPGRYLPKERCVMGSTLELAVNEGPDQVEINGGINADGERVDACRYTSGNVIRTENCISRVGNVKGARCIFRDSSKQWQVVNFDKGGTDAVARANPKRVCDKGVQISKNPNGMDELDWNQPLSEAAFTTSLGASDEAYKAALGTITKCFYHPNAPDKSLGCSNSVSPETAVEGAIGSCIYVKNGKLVASNGTTQDRIDAYNAVNGDAQLDFVAGADGKSLNSYTGWMRVENYAQTIYTTRIAGTRKNLVREGRGRPCFRVEVNLSAFDSSAAVPTLVTNAPDFDMAAEPSLVRECVFEGEASEKYTQTSKAITFGTVSGAPPTRLRSLMCHNEMSAAESDTDMNDWTGVGTNEDPELKKGSCWYFKNLKIKNFHDNPPYFTGWVYMNSNIPDGKFKSENGAPILVYRTATQPSVVAVPCNQGVKIQSTL